VHAAFLALIVFGVSWQSVPTAPVVAQLWDSLTPPKRAASPLPPPAPQPKPQPQPTPPPQPQPQPETKPAPPQPDPEIAAKAERERKKAVQEEARRKKLEEEEARRKKEREEAARRKREDEELRKEEEQAKEEAEQRAAVAASARQAEMQRYVDRIKAKILSRANVPDTVPTGTELTVRIRILPGGDVLDIAVTRSTSPTYSAAIERAIRSAQPLPVPDPTSELFPQFRDLNLNFRHER
jgi:colicin import membrane protein